MPGGRPKKSRGRLKDPGKRGDTAYDGRHGFRSKPSSARDRPNVEIPPSDRELRSADQDCDINVEHWPVHLSRPKKYPTEDTFAKLRPAAFPSLDPSVDNAFLDWQFARSSHNQGELCVDSKIKDLVILTQTSA
jgi:hypothetical protein